MGHIISNDFRVIALVVVSMSCCCGQSQCPASLVTVFPNGTADFSSLPAGAADVDPVYNPGPIGGWYHLAGRFVDAVRPGSLPYDQIRETLFASGLPCNLFPDNPNCTTANTADNANFDVQGTLSSFSTWWIALLIVTIIGGIMACGFCISGMCFCCCRCCGNCGGKKTQQISENMDCAAFTFTIALLLCLAVLFAGVVLAFFSNQQTFESLENTQTAINSVVNDGVTYINNTVDELQQLVCQFASTDGVAGHVIQEAKDFNGSLQSFVTDLEGEVNRIGQTITNTAPGYNMTIAVLSNLTAITAALMGSGRILSDSLNRSTTILEDVRMQCVDASLTQCTDQLANTNFQTGANFSQLPSVEEPLNDARAAIENINFANLVSEGMQTFDSIRQTIDGSIASNLDEGLRQVDSYNSSLSGVVDNVTDTVREYTQDSIQADQCPPFLETFNGLQLNVGYLRECVINGAFREIQQFDTYRYAFGIVICSLALVTVLVALLGILLGMCGFRKNKDPDQRTTLSHCGGVFLILGVILTFVFGFVLLILCCIFFFFGANVQKLCQSVEYPNYPLYVELVDNTSFWGGSLVGQFIPANPDNANPREVSISRILKECRNNSGLFTAANLGLLLPSGSIANEINSRVNLNEIRTNLNGSLVNATRDFNFNSTSFLPEDVQNSLTEFRNSSVEQINITAFREQIEAPLLTFDINVEINRTMSLSATLAGLPSTTAIVADLNTITSELEMIRDQIPMIMNQVNQLDAEVQELVMLTDTVVMETIALVDQIAGVINNITGETLPNFLENEVVGTLNQVFDLLDVSIVHLDEELTNNVAGCFPLWSIYTQLYNTVCQDFIEGLNGFWWSLGFCALMFIPVIVLSVITSNFYLKKKNEVEGYTSGGYDDYPMKSY